MYMMRKLFDHHVLSQHDVDRKQQHGIDDTRARHRSIIISQRERR